MGRIPMGGEARSERIAVFVTLKTKEDLTKVATVQRTSVNLVINNAIAAYLEEHQNDIQRYNDFFGEER